MRKELYKYQQEVVDRATESTALFWDMGLGKTITSLEIFKKFYDKKEVDNLFVMCPISMIDEWCREFENQLGMKAIKYKDLIKQAYKSRKDIIEYMIDNDIHCVALNYDMVWRINDYHWISPRWMLICDEIH